MPKTLVPDFVFDKYSDVTIEFLNKHGIKAILSDVDNTLSPYEHDVPNDDVVRWINTLHKNGIKIALVSNNNYDRLNKYNEKMQLVAYADAKKPSRKCYFKAAEELGVDIKDCAVLGDQLLTDCWSARRVKIPCIIVPPINDKRDLFHRFKRAVEIPFMHAYKKRNKK